VLAARLSEDPHVQVALIEAGGVDSAADVQMPIAFPRLFGTSADWSYMTDPEPGLQARQIALPAGRLIGGSSSLNAMVYIRGNRADFDGWVEEGAPGWSHAELLPYFRKSECNDVRGGPLHGKEGPLAVSDSRSNHPLVARFIDAAVQAGYPRNENFNGEQQEGFGWFQLNQRGGRRCSAAAAYLHPASGRVNLHILRESVVRRVLLQQHAAHGVELLSHGSTSRLYAHREVIVCSGAYGTPHLLMLSGIGNAVDLEPYGIRPIHELPVGENLQNHCRAYIGYRSDEPSLIHAGSPADIALYHDQGRGPLTSNLGEGGGFLRSRAELAAPDLQFMMVPALVGDGESGIASLDGYSFGPCVLKPTSRGRVSLRSAHPDDKPRIVHNFLTTADDRESMVEGVRVAMHIAAQPALKAGRPTAYRVPASDRKQAILAFIQRYAQSACHPVGTCAIGRVVDPQLKVLGIDGLRIVDASVMPSIVRGNTNATVIAIAEKAAALIGSNTERGS